MSVQEQRSPAVQLNRGTTTVVAAFACAVICGTAVNFLAKRGAVGVPPITLNGIRTLTAAALLLLPAILSRVGFRLTFPELWRYALLAALTMGIPHALIFVGLRSYAVTETTVAFVEAAVLGVVVVYLLADGRRVGAASIISAILAIVGLAVFLGVGPGTFPVSTGDWFIFAAAVVTALGMILAESEKLKPQLHARDADVVPEEGKAFQRKVKLSLRKTFISCLIAGAGTLLAVAITGVANGEGVMPAAIPASAWPWIVALAIVGNCLTWFSVFLLIEFKQLILAAAVVAAIPVATEIANLIWFGSGMTTVQQWTGGAIVLLSLAALMRFQLGPRIER